jgi:hypothetical protein
MKVFLDDVRKPPSGYTLVQTYEECVKLLETGKVKELSLDHDLGTEKTGYDVVRWIEEKVAMEDFNPPLIKIHSANPVGRRNMEAGISSINRLLSKRIFLPRGNK